MKKTYAVLVCLLLLSFTVAATEVDVDLDVDSGSVDIDVDNTDASVGFTGVGSYQGNVNSVEQGNYLDTNVEVESKTGGASLMFGGMQKLSGATDNSVEFQTFAYGDFAQMNNRFDNSNYVVALGRVNTGKDFLSAGGNYGVGYRMNIVDYGAASSSAGTEVTLYGDDTGVLDTNQWHSTAIGSYGWGNPDAVSSPSKPGYYTPTNTVAASGSGLFTQTGYGDNGLEMNGFTLGAGTATYSASFSGGLSGSFGTWAK